MRIYNRVRCGTGPDAEQRWYAPSSSEVNVKVLLKVLLATCPLLGASALAQAQSNVEIYGLLTVGVEKDSNQNGGSVIRMVNGPMQLSRLGFRGAEDLGDGLKAIFVLENGFNIDTGTAGQGGRLFGRNAYVGLQSPVWGALTLGRQNDQVADALCQYESGCQFGGNGAHIGDNDNLFSTFRINNAISWRSADYRGLRVGAQYGSADSTNGQNNNDYSAMFTYRTGQLSFGGGVHVVNRPASTTNAAGAVVGDYGFSSPFAVSRVKGAGVDQQRILGAGASYVDGPNKYSALYTESRFNYLDGTGTDLKNYEAVYSRFLTPVLQAGVGYVFTKGRYEETGATPKWHQVNSGIDYFLSKRTDVYAVGIYQRAAGDAAFAQIYTQAPSSTSTQWSFALGIRHRF
jgi:GBP family porin